MIRHGTGAFAYCVTADRWACSWKRGAGRLCGEYCISVRANSRAKGGVGLDQIELFGRQLAGLQQEGIGNSDFADIVQRRRSPH